MQLLQTQFNELAYDIRENNVTYIGKITNVMEGDTILYITQEYRSYEVAEEFCKIFMEQDRKNGMEPIDYSIITNCKDCKNAEPSLNEDQ